MFLTAASQQPLETLTSERPPVGGVNEVAFGSARVSYGSELQREEEAAAAQGVRPAVL